jgi:DNA-binding PucR family transcriptional regulator
LWEDEVIGLLFVADRYHRTHTAQNISILSTLATHAAVAIKNAKAFEHASAALKSAEAARLEVEKHARSIQAAAEAHEQMTSLLAKGASLATISQAVADLMGGCVLVLDEAAEIIGKGIAQGYAGTAADLHAPSGPRSRVLAQALGSSRQIGRSVIAYEANGETCRLNAVIAGNEVLGAILLFSKGPLDEVSIRTFERSASVVGVVLLSRDRAEATQSRDVSSLIRALISPGQDDVGHLSERAERFGMDLSQPNSMLLIELAEPDATYAARRLRTAKLLADVIFDEIDGVLALLFATTKARDVQRIVAEFARHNFGSGYRGIISRPALQAAELPGLYATLRRALPVLRRIGVEGQFVGQNEMALYSTLFESHDQASLAAFLEATIGALLAHDQKRGSELAFTLMSYFDSNQNAKVAAQRLGIHVNTVRQRLATIEELLGHWGSATRALEIHIALRLWSLTGEIARGRV